MNYRVRWHPDAFRRLRRDWIAANEPQSGLRAFDEIERTLIEDAHFQGESRDRGRRILIVPPIGIVFWAQEETQEVLILDAWMISRRKR